MITNINNILIKKIYNNIIMTLSYPDFKKRNKFKLNNIHKKKILELLNTHKIQKIFKNIKINFDDFKDVEVKQLFIKNLEILINNISSSYLYWLKWKKSRKKKKIIDLIDTIYNDFKKKNNFGDFKKTDVEILIYLYKNLFDKLIKKKNILDLVKTIYLYISKKYKNNLIGGSLLEEKYYIIKELEDKHEWARWVFLLLDFALDIIGFFPPFGWSVDLIGFIVAVLRKQFLGAIMSLIAVIPIIGSLINVPYSIIVTTKAAYDLYNEKDCPEYSESFEKEEYCKNGLPTEKGKQTWKENCNPCVKKENKNKQDKNKQDKNKQDKNKQDKNKQ